MNRSESFGNMIIGIVIIAMLAFGIWMLTRTDKNIFQPPSPTATMTATITSSPTATSSPTFTATPTFTPFPPTQTPSPSATSTATTRPSDTATPTPTQSFTPVPRASDTPPHTATFTPIPPSRTPTSMPAEVYGTIPITSPPTDRPATQHADLNLGLRGFVPTQSTLGFVEYGDPVQGGPQLLGLTENYRVPKFTSADRLYGWDWGCNCKGAVIEDWDVTLLGIAMTPGESVYAPDTGVDIFSGYRAIVLYAETNRLTIKYTRDDNVVKGFTLHLEGVAVEPNLFSLYQQQDTAGRGSLPALKAHQRIGHAAGKEIKVAVRDEGAFTDPRSRKDWWSGK